MKLLINEKEISNYLTSLLDIRDCIKDVPFPEHNRAEAIAYALTEKEKGKGKWQKKKHKIKDKIKTGVARDLKEYVDAINAKIDSTKESYQQIIRKKINLIIDRIGIENILKNYKKSNYNGFVKSTGLSLDPSAELIRRSHFNNFSEDCLFRNMDGNEQMLLDKMDNNWSFWFIDTGYTNFLHGKNKVWHRLVRNNLHHSKIINNAPTDRLGIFEAFPKPWRESGDKILIIEPGNFCAKTFGINIEEWKQNTIAEIRKYTDKKIVIREKLSKKVRKSLYKELCDEDYYCVVSINSNASTEAIWAGIPAITLQRHISNPVTRNSISDINNLYRGSIAEWLCSVSYSQFTYEELTNGTAANIVKKYHE